ncbi:hypothetical protein K504DRAFT_391684 [Pleomassaria siparia CBS 279.74]|uniref:DUF8021 domain-containing protein n=1 Tax=Pleomassaria siparia CBS 279.74 TaxID=1314801 RepID=A0A6G1JU90_9PLEO|nr:hypothetical protein K504DRAFT_391684 [Pleomassaria siparia CBS 279.74]
MLSFIVLSLASMATSTTAFECTRDWLQKTSNSYVSMQSSGQQGDFKNIASTLVYLENNVTVSVSTGLVTHPQKIAASRSLLDTTACKTFTELIITTPEHPYVVHTQMTLDGEGNVSLIDSLITDKGDWAFNATGYAYWNAQENWDPIPESQRLSRAAIKAGGDAYADRCNDVTVNVPFGTPCARLEGGAYTGRGNLSANTCNIGGLPEHVPMTHRRYVIDEVYGTVDIFLGFQGLDRTRPNEGTPDSHLFRVEERGIRYIHTVSACWVDGCGMNGTGPPPMRRV